MKSNDPEALITADYHS